MDFCESCQQPPGPPAIDGESACPLCHQAVTADDFDRSPEPPDFHAQAVQRIKRGETHAPLDLHFPSAPTG